MSVETTTVGAIAAHGSHDTHHAPASEQGLWMGGTSPFKASYGKLMMWYFLLSDAFTFSGFLISYGALRFSSKYWPAPDHVFASIPFYKGSAPLIFVTFMTFVLIVSSVTMVRAVQEGHRGNKNADVFWLVLTLLGGGTFLGCQAWEWSHLIEEGLRLSFDPFISHKTIEALGGSAEHGEHLATMSVDATGTIKQLFNGHELTSDQYAPKAFGALFFFITGFHGFHVFSGLVFLLLTAINTASGLFAPRNNHYEMVEKIGLYWHFVDLVWVFVFLVFYLL